MAERRVRDLDDSVEAKDVAAAIANATGCDPGSVKTGEIRSFCAGLGTLWVRCPLVAAKKVRVG